MASSSALLGASSDMLTLLWPQATSLHGRQQLRDDLIDRQGRAVQVERVGHARQGRLAACRVGLVARADLALDGIDVGGDARCGQLLLAPRGPLARAGVEIDLELR